MRTMAIIILGFACAATGYFGALTLYPAAFTRIALAKIAADGARPNQWFLRPQATASSRAVVQPAPDMLYAGCLYDLSGADLDVAAPDLGGPVYVSVYDDRGEHVFTATDQTSQQGIAFRLTTNARATRGAVVTTRRGLVIERRLASDADAFAEAETRRAASTCRPVAPEPRR